MDGGSDIDTASYEYLNNDSNIKIIEKQYITSVPATDADIILIFPVIYML